MRKLQRPVIRALGCLRSKSSAPQARWVPSPCSLAVFSGTWQENLVHTTCHSRCRRFVDGRAQHTWRILVQLCKHVDENPMSSSLPAYRDTTCTEPRTEACKTCTYTNFGLKYMGRKSNACAYNNWGVPIEVLTSVNNAPSYVVRNSLLSPPIELHGHRGSAWREIEYVPLVTDFMGRVYIYGHILILHRFELQWGRE
jgi:hypothetical protein